MEICLDNSNSTTVCIISTQRPNGLSTSVPQHIHYILKQNQKSSTENIAFKVHWSIYNKLHKYKFSWVWSNSIIIYLILSLYSKIAKCFKFITSTVSETYWWQSVFRILPTSMETETISSPRTGASSVDSVKSIQSVPMIWKVKVGEKMF